MIEPKVGKLIAQAKEKIWENPEAALKEVEELAESFGHPENYRALLRFYEVRNVGGTPVLRKAQRLWELTRDSNDPTLWQVLLRTFEPRALWRGKEWSPDMDFVESVWRAAGNRNPEVGIKIADVYNQEDRESRAADVLLEIIKTSEATGDITARCIAFLDTAKRVSEAKVLIQQLKPKLVADPRFVDAWARHVLRDPNKEELAELLQPPVRDTLSAIRPSVAAQVFFRSGLMEEAGEIADRALRDLRERPPGSEREIRDMGELFQTLGRFDEFEASVGGRFPPHIFDEIKGRSDPRRRRK